MIVCRRVQHNLNIQKKTQRIRCKKFILLLKYVRTSYHWIKWKNMNFAFELNSFDAIIFSVLLFIVTFDLNISFYNIRIFKQNVTEYTMIKAFKISFEYIL